MFPPPWTARHDVEDGPPRLIARARLLEDLEKPRYTQGRILSSPGLHQMQPISVGNQKRNHIKSSRERHSLEEGTLTARGCSTLGMLRMTAQMDQQARDGCRSIPKHPPKFCVAIHGDCRLFGEAAILPLRSQVRARARSEATSAIRRTGGEHRFRNRPVGLKRTASGWLNAVRRAAWDDDERITSVEQMRHTLRARRAQKSPGSEPEPAPESENELSQEHPRSEDSMSTHELFSHGSERHAGASIGRDEGCSSPRNRSYDKMRRKFFDMFHEVEDKKMSHPLAHMTTVEQENSRALACNATSESSAAAYAEEAIAKFLRQLSDHGRAPWPAILKWSEKTRAIQVGGMGLGDDIVGSLATVLPILRNLERLVAFDNRMTDKGTYAIVRAVQGMETLTYLDLSENEVGALAAHELREYMRNGRCKLRSLAIRKADIDDDECREFMAALRSNHSLLKVDLTGNLIGKQETMKMTGAESIADMLKTNCSLTSLNLAWNSLRMKSAVVIAQSLRHNRTLRTLGLAYNSFSDYASQILAVSLFENDTITSLDLSYNSVTPSAALVFAFALKVNTTVEFLKLEGNRIGQNGGEALVTAMRLSQGHLVVGMNNCDTSHRDETLFNAAEATGEYRLDLQVPYHRVVACELLKLANRKPTCHFRSLKHTVGKKTFNLKLHRGSRTDGPSDPRADATCRIKQRLGQKGVLDLELFTEYTDVLGMKLDAHVATKLMHTWNEILTRGREPLHDRSDSHDSDGGDFATRTFFETLFSFADKDGKGELAVEDLETLFQFNPSFYEHPPTNERARQFTQYGELGHGLKWLFINIEDAKYSPQPYKVLHLPYGEARMRLIMSKYDADRSGSIDMPEFTHYMSAAHLKERFALHGPLCTEDGNEWQVPSSGILRINFVQEPSSDRTPGEISTDCGVKGLITHIRQSPTDDTRKRLFELATSNSGTYFTSDQAQGLLEAVSSIFDIVEAVAALMPQLAWTHECASFVDSNLDHRLKFKLRFLIGAAWGAMMGLPSGHYSLDMQNARDRLAASKIAAVANHERQCSKFNGHANTSQHGNWQNFRNAFYEREPVVLTSAWFINLPSSGVLRFDYVSTSIPDHHHVPLPERRFQRILEKLGVSTPITLATPIDSKVISAEALFELATSHWRKVSSSSSVYAINQREYYRSGSSPEDVSLASWWSTVEVTSVELERSGSVARLAPSPAYVKAFYKLRELEVALVSSCLTTDQLARILESFPREGQLRAEVILSFYHKVTDIDHMCLLVDALRPDEGREVISRRGWLNCVNPVFADRYYRLDLSVWDDREMAKILVRLAIVEPGENWLEETFQRTAEAPLIPGWELPLGWTTPDVSPDKKDGGGPATMGILTLWYSSAASRGCAPNLRVRQELAARTLSMRVGTTFGSTPESLVDVLTYTLASQQRFRSMVDKERRGHILLSDEIALGFVAASQNESTSRGQIAPSSITDLSNEGTLSLA